MGITIHNYASVATKAAEFGFAAPTAIAVLPENFETASAGSELLFSQEAGTLKKLLNGRVPFDEFLPRREGAGSIHNKHFEWAPLIFISASLISDGLHPVPKTPC